MSRPVLWAYPYIQRLKGTGQAFLDTFNPITCRKWPIGGFASLQHIHIAIFDQKLQVNTTKGELWRLPPLQEHVWRGQGWPGWWMDPDERSRDWQLRPAGGNWIRQMFGQQHPWSPPRNEFTGTGSQQGTAGFASPAWEINKKAAIAASRRGWEVYYRRKAPENVYVNVQRSEMKTISKRCKVPATALHYYRSCCRFI